MSYPTNLNDVGLYLRKSRADIEAEAKGEGETLAKHRRNLLEIAKRYQYTILDIYEEIVSGERIVDRPEMQKLLHNVRDGKYSAVLCMDIDRLGRGNMIDQGLIQEAFKTSETLIITPRKVYDLQNEMDEEWSEFESFMARRELKIITRRMQRGRRDSAKDGRSISKKPPYGYLRDENNKLYPDPETADIVRMIYDLHGSGRGIVYISRYLTQIGAKPPMNHRGQNRWTHSTVNDILQNETYLGRIVWGQYRHTKEQGKVHKEKQPREKWTITENAHEAIVTQEQWERSQKSRKMSQPRKPVDYSLVNPLAGIIRCGICGRVMRKQPEHRGRKSRLICVYKPCSTASAVYQEVEDALLNKLQEITLDAPKRSVTDDKPTDHSLVISSLAKHIEALENEISETRKQLKNMHKLLEREIYTIELFTVRNREVGEQLETLQTELESANQELDQLKHREHQLESVLPAIAKAVNAFRETDVVEVKNRILKDVLDSVVFRREKSTRRNTPFELEIYLRI